MTPPKDMSFDLADLQILFNMSNDYPDHDLFSSINQLALTPFSRSQHHD